MGLGAHWQDLWQDSSKRMGNWPLFYSCGTVLGGVLTVNSVGLIGLRVMNVSCDYAEWTVLCLVIHSCIDCITPRSMQCANSDGLTLGSNPNQSMCIFLYLNLWKTWHWLVHADSNLNRYAHQWGLVLLVREAKMPTYLFHGSSLCWPSSILLHM